MKMIFQSQQFEEHKILERDLIRLHPYGLSLTQDPSRPMLLLRDEKGRHTLPVFLTQIEAGVTIQQSNQQIMPTTPHRVTEILLESLQIKIEKCVFVALKGHHQYMRLYFEGHPTQGSIKVKAEEAMSLCLHLNVPIYATSKFMNRSRVMSAEIDGLSQGLAKNPGIMMKTHEYLI
ncbi:MAG: bifunctional nuclease family protein [Pseudobdellovibrionaceae bacterium]